MEVQEHSLMKKREIIANSTFSLDVAKEGKANDEEILRSYLIGGLRSLLVQNPYPRSLMRLMTYLKVSKEKAEGLAVEVSFTISEINKRELADLRCELLMSFLVEGRDSICN